MKLARGCGTCKQRKIRCDCSLPVCKRCVQSRRICSGYGLRLSWPGENRRTSSKAESTSVDSRASGPFNKIRWLNTSFADVTLHFGAADPGTKGAYTKRRSSFPHHVQPTVSGTIKWIPFALDDEQKWLLSYFEGVSARSLPTFGRDPKAICSVVLPLAMSDQSAASGAVLLSLVAQAALHCDVLQHRAARLKLAALNALEASVVGSDTKDLIRHVATGMLLCSYEIQNKSKTSGHWLWYLCGAMTIIKTGHLDRPNQDAHVTFLLGWTQYYVSMVRFSLRHWVRKETMEFNFARDVGYHDVMPPVCARSTPAVLENTPHKLLGLFGTVIDSVVEPTKAHYHSQSYHQDIDMLQSALEAACIPLQDGQAIPRSTSTEDVHSAELFRLAIMVYLSRAAEMELKDPAKLADWITQAFSILAKLDAIQHLFPLFIFGCEARTDEQRMAVLSMIDKTVEKSRTQSMACVRGMIQFFWVHDDLADNRGYLRKLSCAISASPALPTFLL